MAAQRRRLAHRLSCRAAYLAAAAAVAAETGTALATVTAPARRGRWSAPQGFARRAALYVTVTSGGVSISALARVLGRARRDLIRIVHRAEDERDDTALDALYTRIEARLAPR